MNIPYHYVTLIRTQLAGMKTILDVGSGDGVRTKQLALKGKIIDGIELFKPYVAASRKTGVYRHVYQENALHFKYTPRSFDAVIALQVIEHIEKKQAIALISRLEKAAKKMVFIATPNGHFPQEEYDQNPLQVHQSTWTSDDFTSRGYEVYGQGLRLIYGYNSILSHPYPFKKLLDPVLKLISYCASPLVYRCPKWATYLIAVKKIN